MAFLNAQKLLYVGTHAICANPPAYKTWYASGSSNSVFEKQNGSYSLPLPCVFYSGDVDSANILMSSNLYFTRKTGNTASSISDTGYILRSSIEIKDIEMNIRVGVRYNAVKANLYASSIPIVLSASFPYPIFSAQGSSGYLTLPNNASFGLPAGSASLTGLVTETSANPSGDSYGASAFLNVVYTANHGKILNSSFSGGSSTYYTSLPTRLSASGLYVKNASLSMEGSVYWSASGRVLV